MSSREPGAEPVAVGAPASRPGRAVVSAVAGGVAVLSVLSLVIVLVATMVGGRPWAGFSWIAMIGLPLAFVLLVVLVVGNIRARRGIATPAGRPDRS